MSRRYAGKTVLITGAAGGFGRLMAQGFAAEGAALALSDLAAPTALAEELGGLAVAADVADPDQMDALHDAVLERFGRLDIAINNAGIGNPMARLQDIPVAEYDRVMAVNARGVFLGMKRQIPAIAAAGGGAILNVSSAAGLLGSGHLAAYAASKHAVIGLTRAAADEAARDKVRVNALCPSFAETPLFAGMADQLARARGEDGDAARRRIAARVPMRRTAAPEEIAQAALWICAPENSFMTGQAVAIDGGLTAV